MISFFIYMHLWFSEDKDDKNDRLFMEIGALLILLKMYYNFPLNAKF